MVSSCFFSAWVILTYFMPLVSFYTPRKHQNLWFSDVFRWYRKKSMTCNGTGVKPEIFQVRRVLVELGHFDKLFPSSENFLNGWLNPKMDTIKAFFSKFRALFSIFKKEQGSPPPPPTHPPSLITPSPLLPLNYTRCSLRNMLIQRTYLTSCIILFTFQTFINLIPVRLHPRVSI